VWLDPSSRWRRRYRDWQVALTKLEYIGRNHRPGRRLPGCAPQPAPRLAADVSGDKGNRAEYFDINHALDPDLGRVPQGSARHFPPPLLERARDTGAPCRQAWRVHPATQRLLINKLGGWIGDSDRRVIGKFLPPASGPMYLRAPSGADERRNEELVDLTIVATWHVVDGIHR